jgi:hypothetical protein
MSLIQVGPGVRLPDRALLFGQANSDRVDLGTGSAIDDMAISTCVVLAYFTTTPSDGQIVFFKGLTGANGRWTCVFTDSGSGMSLTAARRRVTAGSNVEGILTRYKAWGLNKWVWLAFISDTTADLGNRALIGDFNTPFGDPSSYTVRTAGSGTVTSNAGSTAWWGNNSNLTAGLPAGSRLAAGWVFPRALNNNELEFIRTTGAAPAGAVLTTLHGDNGTSIQPNISGGTGLNGTVTGATQASGPAWEYARRVKPRRTYFAPTASAYSLALAQGSYALTGQTVGLKAARQIVAAQGSYALTGQAVALKADRRAALAQGSYSLTGQSSILTAQRRIVPAQGAYNLTGQDINLTLAHGFVLTMSGGSYALAGQALTLKAARALGVPFGSYVIDGQAAGLTYSGNLIVTPSGRIIPIAREIRTLAIASENRIFPVS